ncbi:MAG: hypothetical protein V2B20_20905 [Pseudomonadota bacterium]
MGKNVKGFIWLLIAWSGAAMVGYVDWITGYDISFFVFYFLPISIAAWFVGLEASIATAFVSAMVWFGVDFTLGHVHLSNFSAVWNTTVRLAAFLIIGWAVSKIREFLEREKQLSGELRRSLSEIKVLEGFLPICCECKKIRNREGNWQQMEVYIGEHAGTRFSHGYCPECYAKAMKEAGIVNIMEKNQSESGTLES